MQILGFLQRFQHRRADTAFQSRLALREFPEPHLRPLVLIMPFGHSQDRVEAHALQRHLLLQQQLHLIGYVAEPFRPHVIHVRRFGD